MEWLSVRWPYVCLMHTFGSCSLLSLKFKCLFRFPLNIPFYRKSRSSLMEGRVSPLSICWFCVACQKDHTALNLLHQTLGFSRQVLQVVWTCTAGWPMLLGMDCLMMEKQVHPCLFKGLLLLTVFLYSSNPSTDMVQLSKSSQMSIWGCTFLCYTSPMLLMCKLCVEKSNCCIWCGYGCELAT